MKRLSAALLAWILAGGVVRTETADWIRVPPEGLVKTARMFRIRVPADWYVGKVSSTNYGTRAVGMMSKYVYTGPEAPLPRPDNIRCEVAVTPSYPSQPSAAIRMQAAVNYVRDMSKRGYRQGELPVAGSPAICLLGPATNSTEYVVLLEFERDAAIVHVRSPQPGVKFPRAALPLLEGIEWLPPPLQGAGPEDLVAPPR